MIESGTNNQEYDPALALLRHEDNLKADIIHSIEELKLDILEMVNSFDDDITDDYIYKYDPILNKINKVFEDKVNEKFSEKELEDIYKQGEERYKENIPPGYKDSHKSFPDKFGDLVIWNEVIEISKKSEKDILFVSDDRKEDWVDKYNGIDLGPRKELISEFYSETGNLFYSINTKEFIKQISRIYRVEDTDSLEKQTELIQDEIARNEIASNFSKQLKEILDGIGVAGINDFSKQLKEIQSGIGAAGIRDFSKQLQDIQSSAGIIDISKQLQGIQGNIDTVGVGNISKQLQEIQSGIGIRDFSKQLQKYQKGSGNKDVDDE